MKTRIIGIIVACIFLSLGVAQAKLKPKEYSGFLVDYSQLKPGPKAALQWCIEKRALISKSIIK